MQAFEDYVNELKRIDDLRLQDNIAKAELQLMIAQETGDELLSKNLELLSAEREQELSNTELTESQIALIKEKYRQEERKARLDNDAQQLQYAQQLTSSLGDLSNSLFDLQRSNLEKGTAEDKAAAQQQFEVNKAFAISSAIIQGALASVNAFAQIPFNLATATVTTIAASLTTLSALAKITSTKFQYFDGGFTNRGNPKKEAQSMGNAQFHNNEYVVPNKVLSTPQAKPYVSALEKMRKGQAPSGIGGFYDGGFTSRSASSSSFSTAQTQSDLINAVMAMPNPVVKVSDINKVSDSVNVGVNVSSL